MRKHSSYLGMQSKDPVYPSAHLGKFIIPSTVAVLAVCFILGLAEHSQRMTAITKRKQRARQSGTTKQKKNRSLRKSRPADCSQHLATLREQRQEASRMK